MSSELVGSRRLRIASLGALIIVSGCLLPSRDNPQDPTNAPAAILRVIDHTLGDGTCSTDFTLAWPEAGAISRGRCIALDASDTTDPQARPSQEDPLQGISFTLTVTTSATGSPVAVATQTEIGIFVLDFNERRALPPDVPLTFTVAAESEGGISYASRPLVLLNARPVAALEGSRRVSAAGHPWSVSGYTVRFDGSRSFDPDDDPLEWCWSFPDEPETICRADAGDPAFTRTVPRAIGRYAAKLVVRDPRGTRVSSEVWSEVHVGPPTIWLHEGASTLTRLDERPTTIPYTGSLTFFGHVPLPGQDGAALRDLAGFRLIPLPAGAPPSPPLATAQPPRAITGDGLGSIWTLTDESPSGPEEVKEWTVRRYPYAPLSSGGLGVVVFDTPVDSPDDLCLDAENPAMSLDAAGFAWIASRAFGDLRVLSPDGDMTEVFESPVTSVGTFDCTLGQHDDRAFSAIAARPQSTETWVSMVPAAPSESDPVRLLIFDSAGNPIPAAEVVLPASPSAMAFASPDELWLAFPLEGLVLADARALREGRPLDVSRIDSWPDALGLFRLLVDRVTGGVAAQTLAADGPRVHFLDGDRTARSFPTADFTFPRMVDASGSLWVDEAAPKRIVATDTVHVERLALQTTVPRPFNVSAVDTATGWLWQPFTLGPSLGDPPWAIGAVAPDGSIARQSTTLRDGTAEVAVPTIRALRLAPDGQSMWLLANTPPGLYRLDITVDPPVVLAKSTDQAILDLFGSPFGATFFAPAAPDGPFAWVYQGNTHTFHTLDATLTSSSPVFTLVGAEATASLSDVDAALLPATNRLCLSTASGADANVNVRYLAADGTGVTPVFTQAYLGNGNTRVSSWSDAAGNEGCWVAVGEDGAFPDVSLFVTSRDAGGLEIGSRALPNSYLTNGVAAIDGTRAWVTYFDDAPAFDYGRRHRIEIGGTDFVGVDPLLETGLRSSFSAR